jgi:hypothetical protein
VKVFEEADGSCYGHFAGKYLIAADGTCTHAKGGTGGRLLYTVVGRRLEYRQEGECYISLRDGRRRWRMAVAADDPVGA